ncbi:helix-turn-helix transcriptional regulator [Chamaesiphon sp.]|uniref:helix-turn-helix transcriptional regulator n=1 Tax=Chamaesiphon sp. TaxID=2814140 RepID=UPI0035948C7D
MDELYPLELEIVKFLYRGYNAADIASLTTLTKKGVSDRIRSIKQKLDVTTIKAIVSTYTATLASK